MNLIKQLQRKNKMLKANKNILDFIQERSGILLNLYKEQKKMNYIDVDTGKLEALVSEYEILSDYILKELDDV